jgi:hypothetical protein
MEAPRETMALEGARAGPPSTPLAHRRREFWLALAALLLFPLVLVGPSLLPGARFLPFAPAALEPLASENPAAAAAALRGVDFLASDGLFPLLSDAERMSAALSAGEWPLWDPSAGLGAPLFAQSMFGALYPPHWLAFVLEPSLAFGWIALSALVLAGLGLYGFARRVGLSHGASLVGAVCCQGAGFAVANLHDFNKLEAGLWFPWTLSAILALLARERGAPWKLALTVALSWLAGFAPIAAFCTLAALLFLIVRGLASRASPLLVARGLGLILAGFGLAAIQWVPTREAFSESTRGERPTSLGGAPAADGLPLSSSLTLVAPEVFGRADEPVFAPSNAGAWWLARPREREQAFHANLLEWNLFAGSLALSLAAAAIFARPRQAVFPLALALASIGFAQGWPGLSSLAALPGLDLGSPARAAVLAWCGWAWLAALGAEALLAGERRAWAGPFACLLFAILGLALAAAGEPARWQELLPGEFAQRFQVSRAEVDQLLSAADLGLGARRVRAAGFTLFAFASLGFAASLAAWFGRGPRRKIACAALFLAAAAEGAWYARPHGVPRLGAQPTWPRSEGLEALALAVGDGRVLRFDASPSGIGEVLELARPNLPAAYGIGDLSPYVVFTPRRAVELWTAVDPRSRWRSGIARISDLELLDHPVLDVLRVTAILSKRPLEHARLEKIYAREGFHVYQRTGVPPRARLSTTELRVPAGSAAIAVLATRLADPTRCTVVTQDVAPWSCPGGPSTGEVRIDHESSTRITLSTRGTPQGWLVLADAWYPGWKARLDGRRVPVVAVDHALRGVALPAGDHVLQFEYRPDSLKHGAWLSLLALLAAAWMARGAGVPPRVS